jgi:hypothetical protein
LQTNFPIKIKAIKTIGIRPSLIYIKKSSKKINIVKIN